LQRFCESSHSRVKKKYSDYDFEVGKLAFEGGETKMEVKIAGKSYCHLADYLFNEEQAQRSMPWSQIAAFANPWWPY